MLCLTISDASLIPKKSLDMVSFRGVKSPKSKCDQNMYRRGGSAFKEFCPKKTLFWLLPWSNSQHPILERIQCQLYTDNMSEGSKFCIDGYMPDMRKRALSCRAKDDISQKTYIACLEPNQLRNRYFKSSFDIAMIFFNFGHRK